MTRVMEFKKADSDKRIGTSRMGTIDISYDELVSVLGEPDTCEDGDKVDAHWLIEFGNGTVASIYNYKDGKNYNGDAGTETKDIRAWHIGGKTEESATLVHILFNP